MVKDQNSKFISEKIMDLVALIIGLLIGIIIGAAIMWVWSGSTSASNTTLAQATENELKALLAQRANQHLETSRASIENMQLELSNLLSTVDNYQQSLHQDIADNTNNTFFGEHASMFLRNTEGKSDHSNKTRVPDNQPKDFANNGSGIFVGNAGIDGEKTAENTNY